jgi:hypothetical protein
MDPDLDVDPDPAIFVIDLQQKTNKKFFYCLLLSEGTFTSFLKDEKVQNSHKTGFSYYFFCLMIEGSGSGSIPLTSGSGSGSGRPKNMWRWIRIRNMQDKIMNY